jgi:hypothetical protein
MKKHIAFIFVTLFYFILFLIVMLITILIFRFRNIPKLVKELEILTNNAKKILYGKE